MVCTCEPFTGHEMVYAPIFILRPCAKKHGGPKGFEIEQKLSLLTTLQR